MKFTELIVKRPVSAIVIILAVVLFGLMSVFGMTQELMPEMNLPMLLISTTYPGAGPEDAEQLVSNVIEGAVSSLPGVKNVYSMSMESSSLFQIEYEYGTDIDKAFSDLSERLDLIAPQLPEDAEKPIVVELDMNAQDTMSLSVRSGGNGGLLRQIEDDVVPELEKLSAVADVSVSGGREDYIRVELLEDKLTQYGVSMSQVTDALKTSDFSMPSGEADYGNQSLGVRSSVEYRTVQALQNIPLSVKGGNSIRLSDVAVVHHALKDMETVSRYNGEDNISIGIQKRQSASAVTVSRQVRAAIDKINAGNSGVTIDIVNDNSEEIQNSIMAVAQSMILSIILSMIVLFVFLGDLKASLIVGSSMPVSLLVAFIFMSFMGFTLNIVTLSAMVLGVGMMVDNSIVVLDACFKARGRDKTFTDSALEGTKFVLGSIAGSTVTTVVVFFPLAVLKGLSGMLFTPLGFTIIFALTASLLSAMTLTPLFFVQFRPRERKNAVGNRLVAKLENGYGNLLRRILNRKKLVMVISIVLVAGCVFLGTKSNFEMIPSTDEGRISIDATVRPGLRIEKVDEILKDLEEIVKKQPDVDRFTTRAGATGAEAVMGNGGIGVTVYLKKDRKLETNEIVEIFREETKDWTVCDVEVTSSSSTSSMSNQDIAINLNGKDLDVMKAFVREIETEVRKNPNVVAFNSDVSDPTPQAELVVDAMKASAVGFTPMQIASNVNAVLSGAEATDLLMSDDREYTIRVEYPKGKYVTVSDLSSLMLTSPTGVTVPLTDVAKIVFTDTPQTIWRMNSQYYVSISVTPRLAGRFETEADVRARVDAMTFPRDVTLGADPGMQQQNEELMALLNAIITGIFLVFMVMAIQFESIKHSLMVMICIPFSMIGSIGLMFLTGTTISMVSMLGFLILVGTVVNNGILFVDSTNQYRKSMDVRTALIYTGRNRLRPILMTTLTTILSMIPMLFATGSAAMMSGLATVVIGGLTVSTVLTLLLLPTFYLIIDGNEEKKKRRAEKKRLKWLKAQELEFGSQDVAPSEGDPPLMSALPDVERPDTFPGDSREGTPGEEPQ